MLTLMMGSAPLTYLIVSPGYLAGRSLLMNAATWEEQRGQNGYNCP